MNRPNRLVPVFVFILGGLMFSGYLSAVKLFTSTCAFKETCPYFLGYPACWYGFVMYFIMFVVTTLALAKKVSFRNTIKTNIIVSFIGILFAGNFALDEIAQSRAIGSLGLSTCIYGLVFYFIIFIISLFAYKRKG